MVLYVIAPKELEAKALEEARKLSEDGRRVVVILATGKDSVPGELGEKVREALEKKTVVVWSPG